MFYWLFADVTLLVLRLQVEHALQKSSAALATLNRALAVDPRNPLCKYHRASILHATDRHQEALAELNHLREIVPKESNVYFLLGKVRAACEGCLRSLVFLGVADLTNISQH